MGTNLTGDTWGIPGQTFLVLYLVALVLVWGIVLRRRRAIAQGDPRGARTLDSRPEDVAYLNGGPELAVYAALSAMHVDGSLVTSGRTTGQVRAGRIPGYGASALQRAIHRCAQRLTPGRMLITHEPVRTELVRAAQRLETAGLLLSPADRTRYRATAWPPALLGVAGAVRIAAGLGGGRPVGYLFALVAATAVLATALAVRVPARTRAGDAALAGVRSRHDALSPSMRPDWTAVGPAAAALSVGAFGVGAMLAAEPDFAEELAAQKLATLGGAPTATGGRFRRRRWRRRLVRRRRRREQLRRRRRRLRWRRWRRWRLSPLGGRVCRPRSCTMGGVKLRGRHVRRSCGHPATGVAVVAPVTTGTITTGSRGTDG